MKSVSEFNIEKFELLINKVAFDKRISLQTKGFLMSLSYDVNASCLRLKKNHYSLDGVSESYGDFQLFGTEEILSLMPIHDETMANQILDELIEHKFVTCFYPKDWEEITGETKEEYKKSKLKCSKLYRLNFSRVTIKDDRKKINDDFVYIERETK